MSVNSDLLNAFEQRNLGKFQEALEVFQADPNHLIVEKNMTIFEFILSTPKSSSFIKLCVDNDADFYMTSNHEQYPLHYVIGSHCLDNLRQVEMLFDDINIDEDSSSLRRYSPYVNVKLENGENSLHILTQALSQDDFDETFGMIKILISHGCNANFPNYDGKTAFFIALEKMPQLKHDQRKELLEYFLKNADVDLYTHRSEEIIEMVMNQKLKYDLPEREEVEIDFASMMELLAHTKINKFETLFPFYKATCEDSEEYADCCAMFMEVAVQRNLINIVDLLIDYSVDVNRIAKLSPSKVPPPFLACSQAKPAILRLFLLHPKVKLSYEKDGNRKTLLHQFFDEYKNQSYATFRRLVNREMTKSQKKCFDQLMAHPKCNRHLINAYDEVGLPAIYYSVRFKNDYVTMSLLKNGAYVGTVVNGIRKSLLEEFLDSTIKTNDRFYDDEDWEIKIDYNFLTPPCKHNAPKKKPKRGKSPDQKPTTESSSTVTINVPKSPEHVKILTCNDSDDYSEEIRPLKKIAENVELQPFLVHPTIASFILLKWNKISFLVYINMLIIVWFMLSFIPFSVLCQTLPEGERTTSFSYIFFQVMSLISLSLLIVREVTQGMLSIKQYVLNHNNWIDISLMGSALTVLIVEGQIPNHVSRILRTIVILLAAAEYFNLLGMVPILSISIHTKMFKKVCGTFMKSLMFYSMMILAFAFSFYTLQGDKFAKDLLKLQREGPNNSTNDIPVTNATRNERFNNFNTVGSSIIKSFVMLTGELETSYVHTEGITYAMLFLLFLFLVTIVLYNLLNALAVSDTQEIKRDARLIDLNQRILTMYESEEAIFRRKSRMGNWLKMVISMFPKTLPEGCILLKPNRSHRIYVKNGENIVLDDFLPERFKFLRPDVKFNHEIMKEIQLLLTKRREEKMIDSIRRLKESRNEKLANDIIKINELLTNVQRNVTQLQADMYKLSKRANL